MASQAFPLPAQPLTAPRARPRVHLPVLDGVRGVAILAVLVFHLIGAVVPATPSDVVIFRVLQAGWAGVDLFFVLSGYLITGILHDAKSSPTYFRDFYMRRTLRIFPLYYAFLVGVLVVLPWLRPFRSAAMAQNARDQIWLWTYCTNIATALKGPGTFGMVGHVWSLAVEEQFYLVWPAVIYLCRRETATRVCVALVVFAVVLRGALVAAGVHFAAIYQLTPCRIDALAAGAWVALAQRSPAGLAPYVPAARRVAAGAGLALVGLLAWRGGLKLEDRVVQVAGYSAIVLLCASWLLVLLTAGPGAAGARALTSPVLRLFGKYSYAIYLVHVPLIPTFHNLFSFPGLRLGARFASQAVGALPFVVLSVASCLLLGSLSWTLFEKHFLKLKARFE